MLFNSLSFCVFFIVVTGLYFTLPWKWRWKMLLAASCVFYMSFIPIYIFILFATILIDYFMAIKIAGAEGGRRKAYLIVSILSTCLVLFIFKYYNFFILSGQSIEHWIGITADLPLASILLPIGLSFHTFQSLSYVIEVYRRKQEPERNFGIYALYVMFYPQLVAGPIERPQNLLHQFYEDHKFQIDNVIEGLMLIAWGYFQKMVVADRAAMYVNKIYENWQDQSGLALLLATLLFAVQIYADFCGYSHIAIGCARIMGFELMTNFRHPYFASSIGEFWRRWHISLSTWFKDYVYIPLGGSRVALPRIYINLLVTFTISGLWHGANWTFVIWGFYNGLLLVLEHAFGRLRLRSGSIWIGIRRMITLAFIGLGWVFFRAQDMTAVIGILRKILTSTSLQYESIQGAIRAATDDSSALGVMTTTFFFVGLMFAVEWVQEKQLFQLKEKLGTSFSYQAATIVILLQAILLFGVLHASSFIYFQF